MAKVLIAEDNAESRYMLEQLLASNGHCVTIAENGEDALRLARQEPPEVIISDIMMPVMNGFRLCCEVKKDPGLRNIPFIFYTATFVDKADEKLAMSLGASRFIVKPTEGEQFIQILDDVLDEDRQGILPVPERPLEGEDTLLEMYDNSIARKLAETVEKLQDERKSLIKSEQRLKEAQELAQIGHWELDVKSNSLECSDEIYRILGLKPQEFDASYEAFMAFVHPDDRAFVAGARKESLEKKTHYDIEYRVLLKDGTIKYVNERFQTIYDDEGMPACSMGTVQDITERKLAEEKLHHLNPVLRAIREVNQLIVKEKDRDTLIRKTCEILIKTCGYYNAWIALLDEEGSYITSAEAGWGKDFAPMKQLLKQGQWPACAKKALNQKELVITEEPKAECMDCPLLGSYTGRGAYTISLVQNERNYGLLTVSVPQLVIRDEQEHGLIREVAGDIAFAFYNREVEEERKQAEEALLQSESQYRGIFNSAADSFLVFDLDDHIVDANPQACKMYGYTYEELIKLSGKDIVHPDYHHLFEQFKRDVQEKGEFHAESADIRQDGTIFTIEVKGSVFDYKGKPHLLAAIRDITERRKAEKALREAFDIVNRSSSVAFTWRNQKGWPVEFVSENVERIFGYTAEEFMAGEVNYADCIHSGDLKQVTKEVGEFCNNPETTQFACTPYRIIAKDGSEKIIKDWTYIVRDNDGRITHHRGIVEDITRRKQVEEALEDQQARLKSLFDYSGEAIALLDLENHIIEANLAFEKIFGYSIEEARGKVIEDLICPERFYYTESKELDEQSLQGIRGFETVRRRKDNKEINVRISAGPIKAKGIITGRFAVFDDITDRKQVEEDLRHERDFVSRVMEMSPVCITMVNLEGKIIFANQSAEELLGLSQNELTRRAFNSPEWRVTDYDGKPYPDKQLPFQQVMDTGLPVYDVRHAIEWPDGRRVLLSINGAPLFDNVGQIEAVIFAIQNVTEQVQLHRNLQESEAQKKAILDASIDRIRLVDKNMKIIWANRTTTRDFTTAPKDIVGKACYEVFQDRDSPCPGCATGKTLETGSIEHALIHHPFSKNTQSETYWDTYAIPMKNDAGTITQCIQVSRDITDQVKAEKEKDSLQEQLQQSQKMEAIGVLAGGVAHDFNNLLTVIMGNSDLALMNIEEDSPMYRYIKDIRDAGQRAVSLTRQLLAFSRKQLIQPRVLSLNEVVNNLKKMLYRLIGENVTITVSLDPNLLKIEADPGQMEQVIINLVVNARDAMPDGGSLAIETLNVELGNDSFRDRGIEARPGPYAMLAIKDTGEGMDKETQKRIFEPFFTTKERDKGTGLGLSTVYGIVKQNHGYIWVYSEPENGAVFRVYFPSSLKETGTIEKGQFHKTTFEGDETILIIEDDERLRKTVSMMLSKYGYNVLTASGGEEALNIYSKNKALIKLVITDIILPSMDGKALSLMIKEKCPDVKIIYMSGYTDDIVSHYGVLEEGINFIQKPFSQKDLALKVRKALDS